MCWWNEVLIMTLYWIFYTIHCVIDEFLEDTITCYFIITFCIEINSIKPSCHLNIWVSDMSQCVTQPLINVLSFLISYEVHWFWLGTFREESFTTSWLFCCCCWCGVDGGGLVAFCNGSSKVKFYWIWPGSFRDALIKQNRKSAIVLLLLLLLLLMINQDHYVNLY